MIPKGSLDYCFITDRFFSKKTVEEMAYDAIRGGARCVQYREKHLPVGEMERQASALASLCREHNAIFIVNDFVDIAVSSGADGVHVGQGDASCAEARNELGKKGIIGVSANNAEQALKAQSEGADYIGLGPIFPTSTKADAGKAVGLSGISEVKAVLNIPILAIGGITLENCGSVISAGADGVCAISDVVGSSDIALRVSRYLAAVRGARLR